MPETVFALTWNCRNTAILLTKANLLHKLYVKVYVRSAHVTPIFQQQ